MIRVCCLAGIDGTKVQMFCAVLRAAGAPALAILSRLDVLKLGRLRPDLLICDIDATDTDPLEFLRQIRFVLPESLLAVYTGVMERTWGRACHLAGANCLLAKESPEPVLAQGLRVALQSGSYTDPRFSGSPDAVLRARST